MSKTIHKVGQLVVIVRKGRIYQHYDTWAKTHIPKGYKWSAGITPDDGAVGEIIAIAPHLSAPSQTLCAIFFHVENTTCIMGAKGIETYMEAPKPQPKPKLTSNKNEEHDGMIHNPITDKWSWF